MNAERISQNTITMPTRRMLQICLVGVNVEICTSSLVEEGQTEVTLQPPENFRVNSGGVDEANRYQIESAHGKRGGKVTLLVGGGTVGEGSHWEIATTDSDVLIQGSEETPLKIGRLTVASDGIGTISASHVQGDDFVQFTHPRLGINNSFVSVDMVDAVR